MHILIEPIHTDSARQSLREGFANEFRSYCAAYYSSFDRCVGSISDCFAGGSQGQLVIVILGCHTQAFMEAISQLLISCPPSLCSDTWEQLNSLKVLPQYPLPRLDR